MNLIECDKCGAPTGNDLCNSCQTKQRIAELERKCENLANDNAELEEARFQMNVAYQLLSQKSREFEEERDGYAEEAHDLNLMYQEAVESLTKHSIKLATAKKALSEIAEYGKENPVCGFTCAKMASKISVVTKVNMVLHPVKTRHTCSHGGHPKYCVVCNPKGDE